MKLGPFGGHTPVAPAVGSHDAVLEVAVQIAHVALQVGIVLENCVDVVIATVKHIGSIDGESLPRDVLLANHPEGRCYVCDKAIVVLRVEDVL